MSWDVRTKNITCERIGTAAKIKGVAVYGPGGIAFAVGPDNTVERFDLCPSPPISTTTEVQEPPLTEPPVSPAVDPNKMFSSHQPAEVDMRKPDRLGASPQSTFESLVTLVDPPGHDADVFSAESSAPFWSEATGSTKATTAPDYLSANAVVPEQVDKADSMTFYNYAAPNPHFERPRQENVDDLQSILSVNEDIESLASSASTSPESRETAVNVFIKGCTDDDELLAMYQEAASRMDEARFVRNHTRLLKTFFLDLTAEVGTPAQLAAVRFLRLRSERTRISCCIHRLVTPGEARERMRMVIENKKDNLFLLDRLLGQVGAESFEEYPDITGREELDTDEKGVASQQSDDSDISADWEVSLTNNDKLPNLALVSQFLTSGTPFASYKTNFRRFLSPPATALAQDEEIRARVAPVKSECASIDVTASADTTGNEPGNSALQQVTDVVFEPEKSHYVVESSPRTRISFGLSWLRRLSRPKVRDGYRRIEWKCVSKFDTSSSSSLHSIPKGFLASIVTFLGLFLHPY